MAPDFIYFMRAAAGGGPVKIGYSWKPKDRLRLCQPYSPIKLAIVAAFPGGLTVERRLHAYFKAQHSHGEWFHPSDALEQMIADVQAGTFDPSVIPEGSWIPRKTRAGIPWSAETRAMMAARRAQAAEHRA